MRDGNVRLARRQGYTAQKLGLAAAEALKDIRSVVNGSALILCAVLPVVIRLILAAIEDNARKRAEREGVVGIMTVCGEIVGKALSLFNLKPNARWAQSYEILYEKLTEK